MILARDAHRRRRRRADRGRRRRRGRAARARPRRRSRTARSATRERDDWAWAARRPRATSPRAAPSRPSCAAGRGPARRSPPTRSTGSAPRCAATRPPRPARGAGTTPTCSRSACAHLRAPSSARSSTRGSPPGPATTPATRPTSRTSPTSRVTARSTRAPPRGPSSAASSAGRASWPRGCRRCGPTLRGHPAAGRARPPRRATRGSRRCCRRAARRRAAAVPGQPRAAGRPAQRGRHPRRRGAAPPGLVLARSTSRWQRRLLPLLARRARLVITVASSRAASCASCSDVDARRVVPDGVDERFSPDADPEPVRAALGLDRPYVLAVASRTARKNLAALETARARLRAHGIELVAAGGTGRSSRAETRAARCAPLGHVDDEHLPGPLRGRAARSRCRRSTRASGCPCSRRWRAACRSWPPTAARCRRPAATPRAVDPRPGRDRRRGRSAALDDERCAPPARAARPQFSWDRTVARDRRAAERRLTRRILDRAMEHQSAALRR